MKHRWQTFGLIALLMFMVLAACSSWSLWTKTVLVVHPSYGPAVEAAYATGTVEPVIMTPIAPRIGARLVQLDADEGDLVKKGQVLARLESDDVKNSIAQLSAQAEFARGDYLRNAALVKQGIIARQTYDRAKTNWLAAAAAVAGARAQLGFLTLTAPNDGRVIRRDGEMGQYIAINQPLFWLSCLSPLRITADVDEEDVSRITPEEKVLIRADAFPGKVFDGKVQSITPKGDPVARSYRVRIAMPQTTPLRIGMTVEANIIVRENDHALLVPVSALDDGHVWVVRKGRLVHQEVVTGARGDDVVEIVRGVGAGDAVVKEADPALRVGQNVSVQFAKAL